MLGPSLTKEQITVLLGPRASTARMSQR